MAKRKASAPLHRSASPRPPPKRPTVGDAALPPPNTGPMPLARPYFHSYHPPVTANQRVNCGIGLCAYCNHLRDIKLKYEILFGRPQQLTPATPAIREPEGDDSDDEPTMREDNMAFEKICELEATVRSLQRELDQLRQQRRPSTMSEIKAEANDGARHIKADTREIRDIKEESIDGRGGIGAPAAPTLHPVGPKELADREEPVPAPNLFLVGIPEAPLRPPPERKHSLAEATETELRQVYVVLHWMEGGIHREEKRGAVKGVFRDVDSANAAAWACCNEQKLVFQHQGGRTAGEGFITAGAARDTYGRRHIDEHSEVTYAFAQDPERQAYVKVKRLRLL